MKVGDLVEKRGDYDFGKSGIVLKIFSNGHGNTFVKVLIKDGVIRDWYDKHVEVISESR